MSRHTGLKRISLLALVVLTSLTLAGTCKGEVDVDEESVGARSAAATLQ